MLYPRKVHAHPLERTLPFVSRLRSSIIIPPIYYFLFVDSLHSAHRVERDISPGSRKSLRPLSLRREKVRLWIETSRAITNPGSPLDEGNNGFARCFVITGTCTSSNILLESPSEDTKLVSVILYEMVIALSRENGIRSNTEGGISVV